MSDSESDAQNAPEHTMMQLMLLMQLLLAHPRKPYKKTMAAWWLGTKVPEQYPTWAPSVPWCTLHGDQDGTPFSKARRGPRGS